MKDIKLEEKCEHCGNNITLMESVNNETQTLWLVKRCLSCGNYPVTEVIKVIK
jgi:rRNA maturation protein Nop10